MKLNQELQKLACYPKLTEGEKGDLEFFCEALQAKSYQEGQESIIKEIEHDQRKFLDGFSHPKDCEICHSLLPDTNQK